MVSVDIKHHIHLLTSDYCHSLTSLMVSVDIKHHIHLLTSDYYCH